MLGNELKYFSLDCNMSDSMRLIESEFGLKGFAIVIKLFQKIYGNKGYYCEWSQDVGLLFAANLSTERETVGGNFVSEVIESCIRRGIFDKGMYERYSILTSQGIQERYLEAARRRTTTKLISEYLLVKVDPKFKNVSIISKNVDIFSENACSFSQKKREESKRKEINIYSPADAERLITEIIDHLNEKTGSHYQPEAKENVRLILKLLSRNYTKQDLLTVIDKKYEEWQGTEYEKYLRPSTLFGNKFDEYLNQIPVKSKNAPLTKFHNFEQHSYDFKDLESKLFVNVKG